MYYILYHLLVQEQDMYQLGTRVVFRNTSSQFRNKRIALVPIFTQRHNLSSSAALFLKLFWSAQPSGSTEFSAFVSTPPSI